MSFETIGKFRIYFNETYYLAYTGGKRELEKKDEKEYKKIKSLPLILQRKELSKIPFEKNPNVIPIKGDMLLSFIKELKFVPFFDQYFEQSKLLKLTDVIIYESIKRKTYETTIKGGK